MDVCSSNLTHCHLSLPYITNYVINANHQRSQPTTSDCAMCQYVKCHLILLFLCHLLNVGACICHITREGQVKWTTPHHLIRCTLCYSIMSHATLIH